MERRRRFRRGGAGRRHSVSPQPAHKEDGCVVASIRSCSPHMTAQSSAALDAPCSNAARPGQPASPLAQTNRRSNDFNSDSSFCLRDSFQVNSTNSLDGVSSAEFEATHCATFRTELSKPRRFSLLLVSYLLDAAQLRDLFDLSHADLPKFLRFFKSRVHVAHPVTRMKASHPCLHRYFCQVLQSAAGLGPGSYCDFLLKFALRGLRRLFARSTGNFARGAFSHYYFASACQRLAMSLSDFDRLQAQRRGSARLALLLRSPELAEDLQNFLRHYFLKEYKDFLVLKVSSKLAQDFKCPGRLKSQKFYSVAQIKEMIEVLLKQVDKLAG